MSLYEAFGRIVWLLLLWALVALAVCVATGCSVWPWSVSGTIVTFL